MTPLQCKELLATALAPTILVVSSTAADTFVETHYKQPSTYELLRPYGRGLRASFPIKNTQLVTTTHGLFSVRFSRGVLENIASDARHTPLVSQVPLLTRYELFSAHQLDAVVRSQVETTNTALQENPADKDALRSSLYAKLLTKVYSHDVVLPFECFNHPVVHLAILTSDDLEESAGALLAQNGLDRKGRYTKDVNPKPPSFLDLSNEDDSLICFLVLENASDPSDAARCRDIAARIRKSFYYPCLLVALNSGGPAARTEPALFDVLKGYMLVQEEYELLGKQSNAIRPSQNDEENINQMLVELVRLNLIPFMEKKVSVWDDVHMQPRKSLTNRFMLVSRRYFSTPQQGSRAQSGLEAGGYFAHSSAEAATRKLADWAFMLRDYKYAHTVYEALRKDFVGEKTWVYMVAVQEMLVLLHLFELVEGQTAQTWAYYESVKLRLAQIDQTIDVVNYSVSSRSNARSFVLRFQLAISELFNCLKCNTFLESGPGNGFAASAMSYNIYLLKYLNEIISWHLLNHSDVVTLPRRQSVEQRLYHVLKALVMERISYTFHLFLENHSKYSLVSKPELQKPQPESKKPFYVFREGGSADPEKAKGSNMALMGMTRSRKAVFWQLLAANQWDHVGDQLERDFLLDAARDGGLGGHPWLEREGGLLGKFRETSKESVDEEKGPDSI